MASERLGRERTGLEDNLLSSYKAGKLAAGWMNVLLFVCSLLTGCVVVKEAEDNVTTKHCYHQAHYNDIGRRK